MHTTSIRVDSTKILARPELALVLSDLHARAPRSANTRLNLTLVRLACCCGLRASEIAALQITDVRCEVARPHLRIRRGASKGGRSRIVPLWWDGGTLRDLAAWKAERTRVAADSLVEDIGILGLQRTGVTRLEEFFPDWAGLPITRRLYGRRPKSPLPSDSSAAGLSPSLRI